MTRERQEALARQLDVLEARGRGHLREAARRRALAQATTWAARAAIVSPLLALLAAPFVRIDRAILVWAYLTVPALVLAALYVALTRNAVSRRAALGLLDDRLALKDRIAMAAEFSQGDTSPGFREAALAEARPWLERAATLPVARDVVPMAGSRWPFLLAAAVLALLALWLGPLVRGDRAAPAEVSGNGSRGSDAPLRDSRTDNEAARIRLDESAVASNAGAAIRASGSDAVAAQGKAGDASASDGSDASAGSMSASATMQGGGDAQSGGGRKPADHSAGGGDPARRGDADGPSQAGFSPDMKGGQQAQAGGVSSAAATPPGSRRPAAPGPQVGGSAPPPGTPKGSSPSGQGNRPGSSNRQQTGENAGQGSGRGDGQGQSGPGTGQDGLKRSRGTSELLLAVPIEDRVTGTINIGPVARTRRPSDPRRGTASSAVTQARGTQGGDAGRIGHRATTPQEDRMLGSFFRRTGGPVPSSRED